MPISVRPVYRAPVLGVTPEVVSPVQKKPQRQSGRTPSAPPEQVDPISKALPSRTKTVASKKGAPKTKKPTKANKSRGPPEDGEKPLTISVPEAGRRYFGASRNVSYDLAKDGSIPTLKVNGRFRVVVAVMDRLMERHVERLLGEAVGPDPSAA
jgi:hypothetical protein